MDYQIKARPTAYNGIMMRSRLEAKFAAYLDSISAKWEYEPQCFASEAGQYLPDFYLPDRKLFIELKPTASHVGDTLDRMHVVLSSVPDARLCVFIPDEDGGWSCPVDCLPWQKWDDKAGSIRPSCTCECRRPRLTERRTSRIADAIKHDQHNDHLHCLVCGSAYTHLTNVRTYNGGTDGTRYTAVMHFKCESCDHRYGVEVANYKGFTVLNMVSLKDEQP